MTVNKILSLCSLFLAMLSCSKNDDPNAPGNIELIVKDGTLWSATDQEGKPAVEAEVTLYSSTSDYLSNHPIASAKTDASGKVVFKGLKRGAYFFVAKKDNKFNFFDPLFNMWGIENLPVAYRATGIFQNEVQINATPHLPGTEPGDFILADLNGDGKLDDRDKTNMPIEVIVNPNETTQLSSFIGYTFNHTAALFKNKEHAQQVLDNLYIQIGDWHKLQVVLDGVLSDDANCNWMTDLCQLDNFTFTSGNGVIANIWQIAYNNIGSLNRIIQNVPLLNLPATEANRLIAQAKGLRGFIYLQLASYFGELPLQDKIATDENMVRTSQEETWQFIKKDLADAMVMLPPYWTGVDKRRISGNACKLLLARIATYQNEPFKARQYTDEIIQSGTYQLVNASQIFINDDHSEIIWNIKPGIPHEYEIFFADTVARNFSPVIRYSEVLLINSEAKILLSEFNDAKQNLNTLRLRRNRQPINIININDATEALRDTWQKEQYREGQRFVKLVKWGIAMNTLNNNGFRYHNSLLPIPDGVRYVYKNIRQNPGY